jgi:hypothetical protein
VLRLGDLLGETELGLTLRTGPPDAAERPVEGAAVVEVPDPSRWIAPGWVLLSAGVRLEGCADDELKALVAECDEARIAALAFGIGPVFDELPAPLLAEGEARGYPILAVPRTTPFMEVVRFVDAAIMGADEPLFRRLSSLQRFVVDALRDPEPEPARVVLARGDPAMLRHELGEALAGVPHLLSEHEGCVVALVQAPLERIEPLVGPCTGVGRAVGGIGAVGESLRDAELALERATSEETVVAFEHFDLGTLLLSEASPERLEPKVAEVVAVLREHPALYEALVAYFDHDLDVSAAAAELHLHPNSLRYRLTRIEQVLDRSLKRPATIAELHIALLADPRTRRSRF